MTRRRLAILFALLAVSHRGFAQLQAPPEEEERPVQLKVSGGVMHDSNVFRLPSAVDPQTVINSPTKADYIYQLGAGGKYEIRASRQKFIVEANLEEHKYQNFGNLDNDSNDLRAEWQWQAGNFWDGNLGVGERHFLGGFANVQSDIKDMIDQDRVYGTANYRLHSHLRLTLDLNWYDSRHGADPQKVYDTSANNTAFTVVWVTPAENTVGLQYRTTDARYPNRQIISSSLVDNAFHEHEVNAVAHWRVTGVSNFAARVGYTERTYRQLPNRNFSGATWRLTYNWQPSGILAFDVATWREIAEFEDRNANYVETTGGSVSPVWSVTPNVSLQGKVSYQTGKFLGDPGIVPVTNPRRDKERIYQVSALWSPLRKTNVTLTLEKGERTSNHAFVDYRYEGVTLVGTRRF
jgi:exopolysaccharide biosynthesis operon protein EpsL